MHRQDGAWSVGESVSCIAMNAVGAVLVAVAFVLARGEAALADQVTPLNCAVAGLLVAGVADLVFLLSGWRRVSSRTAGLLDLDSPIGSP